MSESNQKAYCPKCDGIRDCFMEAKLSSEIEHVNIEYACMKCNHIWEVEYANSGVSNGKIAIAHLKEEANSLGLEVISKSMIEIPSQEKHPVSDIDSTCQEYYKETFGVTDQIEKQEDNTEAMLVDLETAIGKLPEGFESLRRQVGGSHYKGFKIQPVQFCMDNKLDACQSAVIKYVCRFRDKGGVEDLRKAKHYIDMLIEREINCE